VAEKKIIAVLGATGAQGGGMVRAIINDPNGGFTARALTRDVNGAKAKELAKLGAEVVAADVDDVESLKRAFDGAYGAYCVTFFGRTFRPRKKSPKCNPWLRRPRLRACNMSSGPHSKIRGSGCLSAITACPPFTANIKSRTLTAKARAITFSAISECQLLSC